MTEVTIDALSHAGEGLVRRAGERPWLVRGALPGEQVELRVADGRMVLDEVITRSPERRTPPCLIADRCGGCSLQHASPSLQERAHLERVRRGVGAAAREVPMTWHAAPLAFGYRTRARMRWHTAGGTVALGFLAYGSHTIADAVTCPVLSPALDRALAALRDVLLTLEGGGEVALAEGAGGAPVASLHCGFTPTERGFRAAEALVTAGFAGATLWPRDAQAPVRAGDPRPCVRGGDGEPLWLAPDGFAQANDGLNVTLAETVVARAQPKGRNVLELFAGAGNLTVALARAAERVRAVESDAAACEALRANVAARRLSKVTAVCADAAVTLGTKPLDVVVLDPPRTGAREVCEGLASVRVRRVVYVSCNPETLGRDLGILARDGTTGGLRVVSIDVFEMFPQTAHVEVVAALARRR